MSVQPTLLLSTQDDRVFVTYGFDVYALSTKSGQIVWRHKFDEPIWTGQLLAEGRLLLHLELSVICLNLAGQELWRYGYNDIIIEANLANSALQIRDFEDHLFMLDLATGKLLK